MQNKIFPLLLATIVGIVLGVAIINKQVKDPVLKELLNQQKSLINSQKTLEAKMGGDGAEGGLAKVVEKQRQLEMRLLSIEKEWGGFKMAFQRGGNLGGNAQPEPQGPPPEDFTTVHEIEVGHSPVFGKKDAPVMLVEFMDFQCPYCGRFHPAMVDAAKAYPGKVSYMIKNFPLSFHPQAKPASKAAFAAGEQGKYFEFTELILQNQQSLSDDKFKEFAKQLGLNEKKFWDDYKNKDAEWEKYIQADMELGAKVGVQGTPTYFINGRKTMARSLEQYKQEIDKILAEQ